MPTRIRCFAVCLPLVLWIGLLGVGFVSVVEAGEPEAASVTIRKIIPINRDVREAMRAEATSREIEQRATAIRELVVLLNEVTAHPRAGSPPFRRAAVRLRSRLMRIRRSLLAERVGGPARLPADLTSRPGTIDAPDAALAQPLGGGGMPNLGLGAIADQTRVADYGAELVELIESTVRRDVWQSNGGAAAIVYYQPLHALVISAPASVHDDVGALLVGLRAAVP